MTYREMLQLYKTGKLSEEEKNKVEADIERQDAISEYLYDRDMNEEISDETDAKSSEASDESDFLKVIRTSIRRTFIKSGVTVGTIVLAIVLFIIFAVPNIVDTMYYDPGKIVGTTKKGLKTNQASLDIAAYSELFLHGVYRDDVTVIGNGNAKYDIRINQKISYSGQFNNVGGTINKGKMILFDSNLLNGIAVNTFLPADNLVDDHFTINFSAEDKDYAYSQIDKLDESQAYVAYVTLNQVMSYAEFVSFMQKNDLHCAWVPLCFTNEGADPEYKAEDCIGFSPAISAGELGFDEEQYPLLTQYSLSLNMDIEKGAWPSEENMETHVISLLKYMDSREDFRELMDLKTDFSSEVKDIEENGIHTYGFAMISNRAEIAGLRDLSEVEYISTRAVKYE